MTSNMPQQYFNEVAGEIGARLPQVVEVRLMPWQQSFGADYYGALHVAAEYCGMRVVPKYFPGSWQHGAWPPWQQVQPEFLVYDAPKSMTCFVARQDETRLLKAGGYAEVRQIGLPIIYTKPSGLHRIPNSLLVMPTHSLASDVLDSSNEQYVHEISSIKSKFDVVVACVSAYCMAKGLWTSEFARHNIQVVRGAGISDANALKRMRALFESVEYVTTDSFGSHVFYALYFGAKVSIWGTPTPVLRENYLSDAGCSAYPEGIDKLLSEETKRKGEEYLGSLRVEPWHAVANVELGKTMLGHENKLSPSEMRAVFGWTRLRVSSASAEQSIRHSLFWRALSAAARRLRAVATRVRSTE